jgi:hypothetical protein
LRNSPLLKKNFLRQYIENAYQAYLKRKTLLSNDDLEYISNKDTFLNLNNEIKTFLEESRNLKRARIKTVRRLTIVSALVFILVLAILGYYINKRFSLEESNYRAFLSIDQSPHPVRSLDWAITAWEKHSGIFAKEALIKSFNRILHYPDRNSKMIKITAPVEIHFWIWRFPDT